MLNFLDQKIRKAFSDAAWEYDILSSLHKEIGREVIAKVREAENSDAVLDIGMGTGWLTKKLRFWFPESRIVGIDFAPGMIEKAQDSLDDDAPAAFDIVMADARKIPFSPETFDIIVSNLAYQWVDDLKDALSQCHRVLKKDGQVCITLFGHRTFEELFESLTRTSAVDPGQLKRLKTFEEAKSAFIEAGFKDVHCDYELIKIKFPDMLALVKWIKDIGANAMGHKFYVGRDLLQKANEYYAKNYKDRFGVYSTFEIIWLTGKK